MSADQDKTAAAPASIPETALAVEAPAAATTAATTATATASAEPTSLTQLHARLPEITKKADYREMWGVELSTLDHVPTKVVLQKYLRANNGDAEAAEKQLTSALEWRKKMQAPSLVNEVFDGKKFKDLGFVTTHKDEAGKETIITWNIYGAVKDMKSTFGNVDEFIKWRAAIQELGIQQLKLAEVTEPIPEGGEDPYRLIQVHDYLSVKFFRLDPVVKAATNETIRVFSMAYPELLAHKYFVNVPAIMGWMYGAMKLFMAPATLAKFHPMTSGTTLATELKSIVSTLPKEYGGQGPSVKEGLAVALTDATEETKETPTAATEGESKPTEESAAVSATKAVEEPAQESKPAVETKVEDEKTEETKPEVKAEEPKPTAELNEVAPKEPVAAVEGENKEEKTA